MKAESAAAGKRSRAKKMLAAAIKIQVTLRRGAYSVCRQ